MRIQEERFDVLKTHNLLQQRAINPVNLLAMVLTTPLRTLFYFNQYSVRSFVIQGQEHQIDFFF